MQTMNMVPKKKAQKGYAIDTFLQKGALWSFAAFCGSLLLLGVLLRFIDGLLFPQEEEASTCLLEVIFCGLATAALLFATGPKLAKAKVSSRKLADEEAQVDSVVQCIRRNDVSAAEKELQRLARFDLSSGSAQTIISAAVQADALLASAFFRLMKNTASAKSFQLVVDALVREQHLAEVEDLIMTMLDKPLSMVSSSLLPLFRLCLESEERAEVVLRRLLEVGPRHWTSGVSAMLRADRHATSVEVVERLMQRVLDAQVPLEAQIFNSAIYASARLGQPEVAEKWLKRMMSYASPDPNAFGTVISAYKLAKKSPVADYLQGVKDGSVHLDTGAFNQIIRSCLQAEDLEAADRWLDTAVKVCRPLDGLWFSSVVGVGLRFGCAEIPERWICFQVEHGISKDPASFNAVITCHSRQGNFLAAERLVNFMCKWGIEPDVITLGAAVHSCARANRPRKAEEMFETILRRGHTRPDVIGFNALIDAWVRSDNVQRAELWLERMAEVGVEPTVVSYTTILCAYAKQGNIEAAEKVMDQMKEKQLEANVVTHTALINACVKAGDIPRAERFFDAMRKAGIEANAMTYSSLLNVCAKAGDYRRAEIWLEEMCSSIKPTEVCFNNVIDACSKAGQAHRAEEWLWRLEGGAHGLKPTRQSYTAAAQAYAKNGDFKDVERLFHAMEAQEISMDAFCLTVQLSSYARTRPRQRSRIEDALWSYHSQGLKITPPPLRVAKSVLGNVRLQQLLEEMGLQVENVDALDLRL